MSTSNASETQLSYIAEATPGTIPATPAWQKLRYVSESFSIERETVTSDEIRADRNVSDLIQVGGSAGGSFDGELSYGAYDDFIAAGLFGDWAANVVKNGTASKSFAFEKLIPNAAGDQYIRYTGQHVDRMRLVVGSRAKTTASFDFMGLGGSRAAAIVTGATYGDQPTEPVLNATTDFASLGLTGIASPIVKNVELEVQNGLRHQDAIGSFDPVGIGSGRCEVTGRIEAYFQNGEFLDAFLNSTASSLAFTIGRETAKKYTFSVPTLKFETPSINAQGNDQDMMVDLPFRGLFNAAEACTLKVTRQVA